MFTPFLSRQAVSLSFVDKVVVLVRRRGAKCLLERNPRVGDQCQNQGRQRDRRRHAGKGQRMNCEPVPPELFELDVERGLEEQPRQENIAQQGLRQVGCFEAMQQPQYKAGEDQGYRVGNARRCTAITTALATTKSKIRMVSVSIPVRYVRLSFVLGSHIHWLSIFVSTACSSSSRHPQTPLVCALAANAPATREYFCCALKSQSRRLYGMLFLHPHVKTCHHGNSR